MKTNAINTVKQVSKNIWQKAKRPVLIAAVALPTMTAIQSCCPCFYPPIYHPVPCYPVPCPPIPHCRPHYYGPFCDIKSAEETEQNFDVIG